LMVGEGKKGQAYQLKASLNDFVAKMQTYVAKDTKFPLLALDASQDPMLAKAEAATKEKDFAELNFSTTPVPAALATLSQKQSEVRRLEGEVLDYLASQVGAKEIKFDKIFAVVIPDSRSVVAGTKYKAEVAIGAFSSAITPRISINGSGLPVKEGKGSYETIAQGGQFDKNGTLKRSYTASVSYPKPDGTMETVQKTEEYTVLKPSVEIETASLPPLYLACANNLVTNSPGLGALYQPTFSGTGGDFVAGGGGKVTIVPNSANVVLNINNGGILLDSKPFKVRLVPKPTIQVLANGGPIDEKKGAPASQIRILEVRAISDESFKATNPDDARYQASEIRVTLARGTRPVKTLTFSSGQANISDLAQQAQAGDRYVIAITKVLRKNFRNEIKDVEMGEIIKQLPLY
jgi:gliding motility-associated protein GldM